MKFNSVTFLVTNDCNFNCRYCFHEKNKLYLNKKKVDRIINFIFPFLLDQPNVLFYGGEPLLALDIIKSIITGLNHLNKDKKKNLASILLLMEVSCPQTQFRI